MKLTEIENLEEGRFSRALGTAALLGGSMFGGTETSGAENIYRDLPISQAKQEYGEGWDKLSVNDKLHIAVGLKYGFDDLARCC